jgi:hypothetical protein
VFPWRMSWAQRIIVVIYCLLLAYCCIWVPWRETVTTGGERKFDYVAYSLVWAAPNTYQLGYAAVPDMHLILLRIVALTAITSAVFIIAGLLSSPLRRMLRRTP